MIPKRLDDVNEDDLVALVSNAVSEGRTIEYKQELPANGDGDKKEFLADVSSFANSGGGDLIFGIAEDQGIPTHIVGIRSGDLDLETRRLDSIMASGLAPRIRYALIVVSVGGGHPVLIIRIERSWVGPHRVIFGGHDKFYGRNSAGKYPLDVNELRAAFTLPATVTERIRAFRTDRIIAISNNQTPVQLPNKPKIALHCIPIESFAAEPQYDLLPLYRSRVKLRPMGGYGWETRLNLEGLVAFTGDNPSRTYTQLYRSGVIEAVDGYHLAHEYSGKMVIPSVDYERNILAYLPTCFKVQQELGVSAPVVVGLTLTNTRGLQMGVGTYGFLDEGYAIESETVILPETIVSEFSVPPGKILKPLFDLVWNACGYPESRNFDPAGNWITRT